jgi:hypothetical protein
MAFRFRKSIKIAPGFRLNLGKRGMSVRAGGKGVGYTTGTSGSRVSAGVPGTGVSYSKKLGRTKESGSAWGSIIATFVVLAIVTYVIGRFI